MQNRLHDFDIIYFKMHRRKVFRSVECANNALPQKSSFQCCSKRGPVFGCRFRTVTQSTTLQIRGQSKPHKRFAFPRYGTEKQDVQPAADQRCKAHVTKLCTFWSQFLNFLEQSPASIYTKADARQTNHDWYNHWKQQTKYHLVLIIPRETALGSDSADGKWEKTKKVEHLKHFDGPIDFDEFDGHQILEKIHA